MLQPNTGAHTSVLLIGLEELGDLVADFAIRHLDIILGSARVVHERQEAIVGDVELCAVRSVIPNPTA